MSLLQRAQCGADGSVYTGILWEELEALIALFECLLYQVTIIQHHTFNLRRTSAPCFYLEKNNLIVKYLFVAPPTSRIVLIDQNLSYLFARSDTCVSGPGELSAMRVASFLIFDVWVAKRARHYLISMNGL